MSYDTKGERQNLVCAFIDFRKELAEHLVGREPQSLETAAITLFEIHPHMRSEEKTGLHILYAVYASAEQRGDMTVCGKIRKVYETLCEEYSLENEILAIEKKREAEKKRASAAGQDPSPLAGAGPSIAKSSAQRDTRQVS